MDKNYYKGLWVKKVALSLVFGLFSMLSAAGFDVGTKIDSLDVKDQFEKKVEIGEGVKYLVMATTKDQGKEIHTFLEKNGNGEFLKNRGVVYISELSGAPSFVMSMFMLPKFKDYKYSMGLIRDKEVAKNLPKEANKITLFKLNKGVIEEIGYFEDTKFLENLK